MVNWTSLIYLPFVSDFHVCFAYVLDIFTFFLSPSSSVALLRHFSKFMPMSLFTRTVCSVRPTHLSSYLISFPATSLSAVTDLVRYDVTASHIRQQPHPSFLPRASLVLGFGIPWATLLAPVHVQPWRVHTPWGALAQRSIGDGEGMLPPPPWVHRLFSAQSCLLSSFPSLLFPFLSCGLGWLPKVTTCTYDCASGSAVWGRINSLKWHYRSATFYLGIYLFIYLLVFPL